MMEKASAFPAKLKELIERHGKSQRQAARDGGVSHGQMTAYLSGDALPRRGVVVPFCSQFESDAAELAAAWATDQLGVDMIGEIRRMWADREEVGPDLSVFGNEYTGALETISARMAKSEEAREMIRNLAALISESSEGQA